MTPPNIILGKGSNELTTISNSKITRRDLSKLLISRMDHIRLDSFFLFFVIEISILPLRVSTNRDES